MCGDRRAPLFRQLSAVLRDTPGPMEDSEASPVWLRFLPGGLDATYHVHMRCSRPHDLELGTHWPPRN